MRAVANTIQPITPNEIVLMALVHELETQLHYTCGHAFELQAANVLNEVYASRMKTQLAKKEMKKESGKSAKLVAGDGKPHLLISDTFYELIQKKAKEKRQQDQDKQNRQEAQLLFKVAKEEWKVTDGKRKVKAAAARVKNKKATEAFNKKKAAAAKKGLKLKNSDKPTPIPVPRAIPKPKLKDFTDSTGPIASKGHEEHNNSDSGEDFLLVASDSTSLVSDGNGNK